MNKIKVNMGGRVDYIDTAKGLCMMFVVFVHIHFYFGNDYYGQTCLKSFYLPLFFLLSGLFFKSYGSFPNFLVRKTNTILIPFLFFFYTTSVLLTWGISLLRGNNIDWTLLWAYVTPEHYPNLPLWFLICLFVQSIGFYLIFHLCKDGNKRGVMAIVIFVIGGLGISLRKIGVNLPVQIDSAMSSLPFFFFGWLMSQYKLLTIIEERKQRLRIVFIVLFYLISWLTCGEINYQKNAFDLNPFFVYLSGTSGAISVILLSKVLCKISFIKFIGRYSLMVLCTHQIVLQGVLPMVRKFSLGNWLSMFLTLLIVLVSYVIIVPILKKMFPYFVGQKSLFKI